MGGLLFWIGLQILAGIWLFISPFVMTFAFWPAVNAMIIGALVVILGMIIFYYFYRGANGRWGP